MPDHRARERRLHQLVEENHAELIGYARRRVPDPSDAADVVCDVLLVAWRRIDEVPDGIEGRMWLYGAARRVLANHRRGVRRRDRLAERLRGHVLTAVSEVPDPADGMQGAQIRDALSALSATDRELVTLTAWEGLTPLQVARVLGIEPGTVRVRLHRARRRLRVALGERDDVQRATTSGHVQGGGAPALPGAREER